MLEFNEYLLFVPDNKIFDFKNPIAVGNTKNCYYFYVDDKYCFLLDDLLLKVYKLNNIFNSKKLQEKFRYGSLAGDVFKVELDELMALDKIFGYERLRVVIPIFINSSEYPAFVYVNYQYDILKNLLGIEDV